MKTIAEVCINPNGARLNGDAVSSANIQGLYREFIGDYPKFFKMDSLCKLGFVAAELLLKDFSQEVKENAAIILFNRNGSLITDRNYQKTLGKDNYFPSPALFVYTLANIVTGEIAIRHKIYGETSFYILEKPDAEAMDAIVESALATSAPSFILTGWVDYENEENYLAELKLVQNKNKHKMEELILQLKNQIIEALNLEDMTAEDIDTNAPLFGEGLGLDSIDALELIVLMEREYGIKLSNPAEGKAIFASVATIADYVSKNRKK